MKNNTITDVFVVQRIGSVNENKKELMKLSYMKGFNIIGLTVMVGVENKNEEYSIIEFRVIKKDNSQLNTEINRLETRIIIP